MIGRVTRRILPHLSGVPHLHVNMLLVICHTLKVRGEYLEREPNTERLYFWPFFWKRTVLDIWVTLFGVFDTGMKLWIIISFNKFGEQTENNVIKILLVSDPHDLNCIWIF